MRQKDEQRNPFSEYLLHVNVISKLTHFQYYAQISFIQNITFDDFVCDFMTNLVNNLKYFNILLYNYFGLSSDSIATIDPLSQTQSNLPMISGLMEYKSHL